MKCKKISYIVMLAIMLLVGINKTYAVEEKHCYYISNDDQFRGHLKIKWGYPNGMNMRTLNDYAEVRADQVSGQYQFDPEIVVNWWKPGLNNWYDQCITGGSICFDPYYKSEKEANNASNPSCPKYLVFQYCKTYYIWGTESKTQAENAVTNIKNKGCTGFYASHEKDGKEITAEEYYGDFEAKEFIRFNEGKLECSDLFGNKNDENSLRYMIDLAMGYIRIIVPILIILLGTIDFAKAVMAGKEDNMKKAQTDFVKRVLMGVAVFFVPVLIDLIMDLAEIVWQGEGYKICNF